ncbi:MAG TPA: HlyD family efflux transporter periplasmic adaptor subunit [Thiobacillaceae bacterium]|nr:HlyD family efflux transporter periplasmic adaptor subunit [Thiobacillaceae bacterium]
MNLKKFLLPVALLALGVGGFAALKATKPKQPAVPPKEQVWRVEVVPAQPSTLSPGLTLNGTVESPRFTEAAAPGVGRIARVPAREGQVVGQGQVLLEMDDRDFVPKVAQARGEVDELVATIRSEELRHASDLDQLAEEKRLLEFAAADVARFERLREEKFYSQAAVDQSRGTLARQQISLRSRELAIADHKARLAQLQARLTRARANLEQAELALARSRVVAPFAGYVAKLEVATGDQVNTGQTLLTLYPADGLEIRAKLPATHQDAILARMDRDKALPATALVGGRSLNLRLSRVAGAADTRGLDAFFVLNRPDPDLRLGSLVTLQLSLAPVEQAVSLPYTALYNGRRIYRVRAGRLEAVEVKVLGEQGGVANRLLVHSPELRKGDPIVTTHLPNAVSGLRVEVKG